MKTLVPIALAATAALLLLATVCARAEPLEPPRYPDVIDRPHYLPSWERTQRGYLPSYQYELERRKLCGNLCDDMTPRRRDPFER